MSKEVDTYLSNKKNNNRYGASIRGRLMEEGLNLVKYGTKEDWLKFVDLNTSSYYSAYMVKATIAMMKLLEKDITVEEADKIVLEEKFGLDGLLKDGVVNAIAYFAKRGIEFRNYWNKKYGIDDPDHISIINPTVLKIK